MKKIIAALTAAALISTCASAEVIYDYKTEKTLTQGVTHTHIKRFEENGWQNINIITADLENPYIKAQVLMSEDGISNLKTIKSLAETNDTVAAVNSDFFQWSGTSGKKGSPIGITVKDGKIISSSDTTDNMAAVEITKDNSIIIDYLKTEITITAPNGESMPIKHINKFDPLDNPVLYTSDFAEITGGSHDNILEVVIDGDGIVTEMRRDMDGVEIPEGGYVIRHLPEYDPFLTENLEVGDKLKIDIETSFDFKKAKDITGGGTMLLTQGQPAKNTHDISGSNPRTIAGCDKSGKTLYLITVDGRQDDAAGMTMSGMTEFLTELGVYDAINLDGGGSTTLVTKDRDGNQIVANKISGSLRAVSTGIGITSDAPRGDFGGFSITTSDTNVFSGGTRTFEITNPFDEYNNPYNGEIPEVRWTIQNGYGYFEENVLYADGVGDNITVTASAGDFKTSIKINILDTPEKIVPSPSHFKVSELKNLKYTLKGYDKNGYEALIEYPDVTISDNSIKEMGYKEIKALGKSAYLTVSSDKTVDFESFTGNGYAYPKDAATAAFKKTTENSKSGSASGKLSYDFTSADERTKAAYASVSLDVSEHNQVGVWVYSEFPSLHWLRASFETEENEVVRSDFTECMDYSGWKFLTAKVPDGAEKLTEIYLVQNDYAERNSGYILIDDLCPITTDLTVSYPDSAVKVAITQSGSENSDFSFSVIGGMPNTDTLLTKILTAKAGAALKAENTDMCWSLGGASFNEIKEQLINGYSSFTKEGSLFINLNNSDAYISRAQYVKLAKDLKGDFKNLFIFMCENPVNMSNKDELKVLYDLIADTNCKSVYVFYPDRYDRIYTKNGITFVQAGGIQNTSPLAAVTYKDKMTFVKVTLKNGIPEVKFTKIY